MKTVFVNNGIETKFNIREIQSGSYLIAAQSDFKIDKDVIFSFSDADIIIIEN